MREPGCKGQAGPRDLEAFRFTGSLEISWKYCFWGIWKPLGISRAHQGRGRERMAFLLPANLVLFQSVVRVKGLCKGAEGH